MVISSAVNMREGNLCLMYTNSICQAFLICVAKCHREGHGYVPCWVKTQEIIYQSDCTRQVELPILDSNTVPVKGAGFLRTRKSKLKVKVTQKYFP